MSDKLPSGKWRVRFQLNGKRFTKVFPNKATAEKFESQVCLNQVDHLIAKNDDNSLTFSKYAEIWLRDYCRVEKAESQWHEDESVIRNHLNPAFGGIKLKNLSKSHLAALKAYLHQAKKPGKAGKPYRPKSINNILATAKVMLSTAVIWELVPANPFSAVSLLKVGDQDFSFWRPEDRDQFIAKSWHVDRDWADVVLVACHTGLREGEIGGLRWGSIDLVRRKLRVHRTYSYKLKKEMERTKNMKFVDLPMNKLLVDALTQRKQNASKVHGDDLVFPMELLKDACRKLRVRCKWFGVPPIRFHDLRHTFASTLAMAGVSLMVIKELMRHQSYQMTLRYAHLHPDHLMGSTDVLCQSVRSDNPESGHGKSRWSRNSEEQKTEWSQNGHETQKRGPGLLLIGGAKP